MEERRMESYVYCPACGEGVRLVLSLNKLSGFIEGFENVLNIPKGDYFGGENACKCGKKVIGSIHITAV
jgi:hypothetical protein